MEGSLEFCFSSAAVIRGGMINVLCVRQLEKQKQICFNVLWLGIIKLERCYIIGETIPLAPYILMLKVDSKVA
jgi:hypothetical protein